MHPAGPTSHASAQWDELRDGEARPLGVRLRHQLEPGRRHVDVLEREVEVVDDGLLGDTAEL